MIKIRQKSSTNPVEDALKKCVISDGFEQLSTVPLNNQSQKLLKKINKRERMKTKGSDWFNFPRTKQTEEIRQDLEVLRMRAALDPKRFYKKNDLKVLPKYFQVGRIVDNPTDFYSSRVPKKERKKTLVEELMVDTEFKKFTKRKFNEIIQSDPKRKRKAMKHAKKLKRLKRK